MGEYFISALQLAWPIALWLSVPAAAGLVEVPPSFFGDFPTR